MVSLFSNELEKVSVQLKWKYQFQFAGFIVAKEKGFYKDEGLDVALKEYNCSVDTLQDMRDGKIEFGVSDSSLILESIKGEPIVALMPIYQSSPYIIMSNTSSGIKSLKDLNHKQIAMYNDLNGMVIQSILKANNVDFIQKTVNNKLQELQNKEVDAIVAYSSNEPFLARERGMDIHIIDPNNYGFERYGDILFTSSKILKTRAALVDKMHHATRRGFEYAFTHIDEVVELIYNKYNTQHKSKEALTYEANTLKKMTGLGKNFGVFSEEKVKSIAYIYCYMKPAEYNLTFLNDFIYQPVGKNRKLSFSEPEKRWLAKKQSITYVYDPDWAPFEWKNGLGEHTGIISDIMKIISNDTGIKFIPIHTKTWSDSVEIMKNHKADMYSAVSQTKKREESFNLTKANIYTYPVVLVSKIENSDYIVKPESGLKGREIGIIKGNALSIYIKNRYPEATFIEVLSAKEGFDRVTNNSIDLFAINAATAIYFIHQKGYSKIKIYKEMEHKLHLKIALQKTMSKEILTILDRSLQNISKEDLDNIFNKWTMSVIKEEADYTLFWQIFMLLLIFIIIGTYYNIRLKKQNRIIKSEKDKFQNIFDKASDGISIMTNGLFTECNDALVKMLKYKDKNELLTLSPSHLSPPFQPDGQASLAKSLLMIEIANTQGVNHYEWRYLKSDGTAFWTEIILTNISQCKNESIIHVVWRDIQKRKENEKRLKELNHHLEEQVALELEKNKKQQVMMFQQSRLAQMGEMLSMIAHQWRQPLAAISATSASIELKAMKNKLNAEDIQKKAHNISNFSLHLSETINDFRNFFKQNKKKTEITYDKILTSVLEIIETPIINHNIELIKALNCHEPFYTYEGELKQVILNLIKNAEDILQEKAIENPVIKMETYTKENNYILKISDNGGGIDASIIDKVFDPYFSTKTKRNGTGLGLYMSKMIIEEHCGGKLSVSNGNKGAIFTIQIPKKI